MKNFQKIGLTLVMVAITSFVFAQNKDDAKALIKEGVALHDQGKYVEAIDKYKAALKIDPESYQAYYELSFTLYALGKGGIALRYLNKTISPNSTYKAEGYDLMGNIFDDDNQPDTAIEYYKKGIKADPQYQRLYFNIGISYLRQKKYSEAETYAIDAIKLDPKHASSQRIYAIATYRENKRGCSLLAWCSFLMLEPQTQRSPEAYNFIKSILNYGIKITGEKSVNISVSGSDLDNEENLAMPLAVLEATQNKKDLTAADSLKLQLTSVFGILAEHEANKQTFFSNFYAKYFGKLAESGNMPAFARTMNLSLPESEKWVEEHPQYMNDLYTWVKTTQREF